MLIGDLRLIPSISDANLNLGCVFRSKLDVQSGRFVVSNDFAYVPSSAVVSNEYLGPFRFSVSVSLLSEGSSVIRQASIKLFPLVMVNQTFLF